MAAIIAAVSLICFSCDAKPDNETNVNETESPAEKPEDCDTYGYILDTEGNPVAGITVSDGFTCTQTDKEGMFKFYRNPEANFINYSIPSDFEVNISNEGIPDFYLRLEESKHRYDFTIKKLSEPENNFKLIAIGDPQITENAHAARFKKEAAADIKEYAISSAGSEYGIILGDFVGNKWNLYNNIFGAVKKDQTGIISFACIGNHDHEFPSENDKAAKKKYEDYFGPTDYSFNRGDAHIVVMDNIIHGCKESAIYNAGLTKEQFEWLKQDLSFIPKDKLVIFCVHIPFRNGAESGGGNVNKDKYYSDILELLSEYKNATILSAHTHSNINYIHKVNGKEIFEHITGTTCGAWWNSTVCTEGTPIGYGIYSIQDNSMEKWIYKSVKHDEDFQIRLYRGTDTFTGGGQGKRQFSKSDTGQIVANIWNWDKNWKVEVFEDGILSGEMINYKDIDAWTVAYHIDVAGMGSSAQKNTDHLFYYTLKNPDAKIKVRATDRFGNTYEQETFTDPDSNPAIFHANF